MSQSGEIDGDEGDADARALRLALMESRQRWRQFGAIATDLAFETDTLGNLTFLAPDHVLGAPAATLLGGAAHLLLANPDGPNPFQSTAPLRRRHTWLRLAGGGQVCMALSGVAMRDEAGRYRGMRGIGVNVTDQDQAEAATAAALRRAEALDHIMAQMRQEVLAPRMMRAVLDAVVRALGGGGGVVQDLGQHDPPLTLHASSGSKPESQLLPILADILAPLALAGDETQSLTTAEGVQVLACPCSTRFGDRAALVVWRPPGARAWDEDDRLLAGAVSGVVRIVLEHEAIQRELARQARTDALTGLLNRRAFMEEAARRMDRLRRGGESATLMFLDVDRLKHINDRAGHDAGDAALVLVAALLHRTFRPTDLVARLGGDEFAVWLDGADSLTAAERAEQLRLATPRELAHLSAGGEPAGLSIGIAVREAASDETLEQLIHRADQVMYEVKRNGRSHWRVSHRAHGR